MSGSLNPKVDPPPLDRCPPFTSRANLCTGRPTPGVHLQVSATVWWHILGEGLNLLTDSWPSISDGGVRKGRQASQGFHCDRAGVGCASLRTPPPAPPTGHVATLCIGETARSVHQQGSAAVWWPILAGGPCPLTDYGPSTLYGVLRKGRCEDSRDARRRGSQVDCATGHVSRPTGWLECSIVVFLGEVCLAKNRFSGGLVCDSHCDYFFRRCKTTSTSTLRANGGAITRFVIIISYMGALGCGYLLFVFIMFISKHCVGGILMQISKFRVFLKCVAAYAPGKRGP